MKISRKIIPALIVFTLLTTITLAQTSTLRNAERLVKAISLSDEDAAAIYNAACAYSLAGKSDEAFEYLNRAIELGFTNIEHMKKDSDLEFLRSDARWQKLIERAETKQKEQKTAFWNSKEFWDSAALKTPYQENIAENEKLAGLMKLWSEVKYNFINFDLVPDVNWDNMLLEYLPRVKNTKSTLEYYNVLREMIAKLQDGHTDIFIPKELQAEMYARPAIKTRLIEDRVLILDVFDDVLKQSGIERGQEISAIDGVPVKEYAEKNVMPYQSASTKQSLEVRAYEFQLLVGSTKNPVELTLKNSDGKIFKKTLPRLTNAEINKLLSTKIVLPMEFKKLPGNVAYVALNGFGDNRAAEMFEAAFDEIAKSDGLIIDVRENGGGNSSVGWKILSFLTDKPFPTWQWYTRQYRPAFRAWERPQNNYGKKSNEISPNGKKVYSKPVTVLTSPRTFSAAEDFMVSYHLMKRGMIIGEATGGSTGQPLVFGLPGGGAARVCTMRVKFPNEDEWIGKGIQPDKIVAPTVDDFRKERDAAMEAAIRELKNNSKVNR